MTTYLIDAIISSNSPRKRTFPKRGYNASGNIKVRFFIHIVHSKVEKIKTYLWKTHFFNKQYITQLLNKFVILFKVFVPGSINFVLIQKYLFDSHIFC